MSMYNKAKHEVVHALKEWLTPTCFSDVAEPDEMEFRVPHLSFIETFIYIASWIVYL